MFLNQFQEDVRPASTGRVQVFPNGEETDLQTDDKAFLNQSSERPGPTALRFRLMPISPETTVARADAQTRGLCHWVSPRSRFLPSTTKSICRLCV